MMNRREFLRLGGGLALASVPLPPLAEEPPPAFTTDGTVVAVHFGVVLLSVCAPQGDDFVILRVNRSTRQELNGTYLIVQYRFFGNDRIPQEMLTGSDEWTFTLRDNATVKKGELTEMQTRWGAKVGTDSKTTGRTFPRWQRVPGHEKTEIPKSETLPVFRVEDGGFVKTPR